MVVGKLITSVSMHFPAAARCCFAASLVSLPTPSNNSITTKLPPEEEEEKCHVGVGTFNLIRIQVCFSGFILSKS